jgi:hypothetical protein
MVDIDYLKVYVQNLILLQKDGCYLENIHLFEIMKVISLLCKANFYLFFFYDSVQLQKLEREYYWIMGQVWLLVKLQL